MLSDALRGSSAGSRQEGGLRVGHRGRLQLAQPDGAGRRRHRGLPSRFPPAQRLEQAGCHPRRIGGAEEGGTQSQAGRVGEQCRWQRAARPPPRGQHRTGQGELRSREHEIGIGDLVGGHERAHRRVVARRDRREGVPAAHRHRATGAARRRGGRPPRPGDGGRARDDQRGAGEDLVLVGDPVGGGQGRHGRAVALGDGAERVAGAHRRGGGESTGVRSSRQPHRRHQRSDHDPDQDRAQPPGACAVPGVER